MSSSAPRVEVGQVVLWSDGPNKPGEPAIVLKVSNSGTLTVSLHSDHTKDHRIFTGVRYHGDTAWLKSHPDREAGVWDLTPRDKAIDEVLDYFSAQGK